MSFTLETTGDGSLSCKDEVTGELCHNRAGAYTEALKHYTEASGAVEIMRKKGRLRVLDACYGMGYNSWVLITEILKATQNFSAPVQPFTLSITAVETSSEVIGFLPLVLENPMFDILKSEIPCFEHNIYYRTQECLSNAKGKGLFTTNVAELISNKGSFEIEFRLDDLRTIVPTLEGPYDLIFHDPFSPVKMPELWTTDIFREYARLLEKPDGKLLTYSASASVRGGMLESGLLIGKTSVLGAKKGGTIAGFQPDIGISLNTQELGYLATQAGIPFRDREFTLDRQEIQTNRLLEQQESLRPSGNTVRQALGMGPRK